MALLLIIAVTTFLTIVLALLAIARRPPNRVEARAEALSMGLAAGRGALAGGQLLTASRVSPSARGAVQLVRRILPDALYDKLEQSLVYAGNPVDPGLFLLFWIALAAAMVIVGPMLFGQRGLLLAVLVGGLGPYMWLRRTIRKRHRLISRALPDAMDLLVACVEAGLALDAALVRVGDATEGPLGGEIRLTLTEIAVGRPRQEALLELGTRSGVEDLDNFLRPIIQAERAGVSIGDALRTQANSMREQRRQRAKEKAEKIPAKMTVPMVVFFLPCIMLVAVAPAVFTLKKVFAGF